jgi:hypothetical protein
MQPRDPAGPGRKADQFIVRFPPGMRDRIAAAARENGRSMNAEIVHRLEQSFAPSLAEAVDLRSISASDLGEFLSAVVREEFAKARAGRRKKP